MSTPNSRLPPKNYIATGIGKHLLTPCRRVGLSRRKNTPQSAPLLCNEKKTSNNIQATFEDTPKRAVNSKRDNNIPIPISNSKALKIGDNAIENEAKKIKSQILNSNIKDENEDFPNKNSELDSPNHTPLISKVTAETRRCPAKRIINFSSGSDSPIPSSSQENLKSNLFVTEDMVATSDNSHVDAKLITKKKRQQPLNSDSDSDDFTNSVHKSSALPSSYEDQPQLSVSLKRIKVDKSPLPKLDKKEETYSRPMENEDSDSDFTSTPESEQKQREHLLNLIAQIEMEILEKVETIESLKRAKIYKHKHSPVQLRATSDVWAAGCKRALNDLLRNLQDHAPIDMTKLIQNLKIPVHVVNRLNM